MAKDEKTARELAKPASKILRDDRYSKDAKRLAGSVLTQTPDRVKKTLREDAKKRGKAR